MNRDRSSFLIAAGISLAVHAMVGATILRYAFLPWQLSPQEESGEVIVAAAVEPMNPLDEFEIGDARGTGYAAHDAPALNEATAPEADTDQAFLSLDPPGVGEKGLEPTASQSTGKTPGQRGSARFGVDLDLQIPRRQSTAAPVINGPTNVISTASVEPVQQLAINVTPQPAPADAPSPTVGNPTAGTTPQPAADSARMSDSESDPFSRIGSATFVDGAWKVRMGRKVKTRKPKLLLAAQEALLSRGRASIEFDVKIDGTGKVTSVRVLKSSGSNDLDQPTLLTMYDWWFEPTKDAAGNPVPDQFKFTIGWR